MKGSIFASISVAMIFCTCAKIYIQSLQLDLENRRNDNAISTRLNSTMQSRGNPVIQQEGLTALAMDTEIQIGNSIG